MLADTEGDERSTELGEESVPVAPCPQCGFEMVAIRGSKDAICRNCGFKDSCCY
jgi:predicted RNA-binding Zn-ribbon protein involved in translation (DUF1610 family)